MKLQSVTTFPLTAKDLKGKVPKNNKAKLNSFKFSTLIELDIYSITINQAISPSSVLMYENLIKRGENIPPIIISRTGLILDGRHRLIALRNCNIELVKAYVANVEYQTITDYFDIDSILF